MKMQLTERSDVSCCLNLPHTQRIMYIVYIIRNIKSKSLYYGFTKDLERRLDEHNKSDDFELINYEAYKSEKDARIRERRLKNYAQALTAIKGRLKDSLNAGCGV